MSKGKLEQTASSSRKKEIFGWAMFDFANSSYTTVIITVVYSVIFPRFIVGDAPDFKTGNFLWSLALSISYVIAVFAAPAAGKVADKKTRKKSYLALSAIITISATASLYFVSPGCAAAGIILIVISSTGFSVGESLAASFLPSLGPSEKLGKISGIGWGIGYFGGLISTAVVLYIVGDMSFANFESLRLTGPVTALFFAVASVPAFLWLKEPCTTAAASAQRELSLRKGLASIKRRKDLAILLLSFFASYAGLSIVISFAFIYGDQIISWSSETQALMFVLTQISAAAGSFAFGWIQDRWSPTKTYLMILVLWIAVILMIFRVEAITVLLNKLTGLALSVETVFLGAGSLAGLGLGSLQSASRTLVGLFCPPSRAGEFFGLWGTSSRLAAVTGLMMIGLFQALFGLKDSIIICALFFCIAFFAGMFINESRGIESSTDTM